MAIPFSLVTERNRLQEKHFVEAIMKKALLFILHFSFCNTMKTTKKLDFWTKMHFRIFVIVQNVHIFFGEDCKQFFTVKIEV